MKLSSLALAAGVALAAVATASFAQEDPIKKREELMKGIGDSAKVVGPMLQGKAPFDAERAKAALAVIAENAAAFPNHFPAGSDTGKTEALPAIWENKADFEARAKKLAETATAAAAATGQGEAAFKEAAGATMSNCKGCHEKYRKPS